MGEDDERDIAEELAQLREEQRELSATFDALVEDGKTDPMHLYRLKKRKLALKDRIAALEDQMLPDIIA